MFALQFVCSRLLVSAEIRQPIQEMSIANPLWGASHPR
jgi:hypothetical protein